VVLVLSAAAVAAALALALVLGPSPEPSPDSVEAAVRIAGEAELVRARDQLLEEAEARRARGESGLWATVMTNLRLIESTAAEISAALDRDPGDRRLHELLARAYRREIELLQHALGLAGDVPTDGTEAAGS
jgi:hypothetical protein